MDLHYQYMSKNAKCVGIPTIYFRQTTTLLIY